MPANDSKETLTTEVLAGNLVSEAATSVPCVAPADSQLAFWKYKLEVGGSVNSFLISTVSPTFIVEVA